MPGKTKKRKQREGGRDLQLVLSNTGTSIRSLLPLNPQAYQPISAVVIDIIHDGVITNKKRTTKNNPSTIFLSKGVF